MCRVRTALSAGAGGLVWKAQLGPPAADGGGVGSSPCLSRSGAELYVGGQDGVWALDLRSGAALWHFRPGAQSGSSPALLPGGGALAVGSEDGYLYVLNVLNVTAGAGEQLVNHETQTANKDNDNDKHRTCLAARKPHNSA